MRLSIAVASVLAAGLLACSAADDTRATSSSRPDAEPSEPLAPSPSIEVHAAWESDAERDRFETHVLPKAKAFLEYWARVGLTPIHPARIYISPPVGSQAKDAVPQLYGSGIVDAMRALEADVEGAPSTRDAFARIDAFTCAYPPLDRALLEELEQKVDDPAITPAVVADALRERHASYVGDESFVFRLDNGEFELPSGGACSYLLLGRSTKPDTLHFFLDDSVVMHELGHALHYGLWSTTGGVPARLSASVNEAVADLLAHLFDGNPCHGVVLDAAGNPTGCRRTMSGYTENLEEALRAEERGTHDTGQVLRDFFWTQRDSPDVARGLRAGVAAAGEALRTIDAEPLALAPVFDDEMLGVGFRIRREWEASFALTQNACAQTAHPVCDTLTERLGASRRDEMDTMIANSPTAIGEGGRVLPDGRTVAFEVDGAIITEARVTSSSGTLHFGSPEPSRTASGELDGMVFSNPNDPTSKMVWSTDGHLTLSSQEKTR